MCTVQTLDTYLGNNLFKKNNCRGCYGRLLVQKSPWTDFLTGDEFKYAPEKRLNGQSEVFYFTANENTRDHYKLSTDKGSEYAEK